MASRIFPEILLRILDDCKPLRPDITPWHEYPWPYSQVCQHWRDILLSSPMDWAHVRLSRSTNNSLRLSNLELEQNQLIRCRLQLERSKNLPLSIVISESVHEFHPALAYLFQESHRWRDVKLESLTMTVQTASFLGVLSRCAYLETLTVMPATLGHLGDIRLDLPFLRRLQVVPTSPQEHLLCSLRAPALEELDIQETISITSLKSFLQASQPTRLMTLSLENLVLDESTLPLMKECFQLCNQLYQFTMYFHNSEWRGFEQAYPLMLRLLTWEPGSRLLPKLSKLELVGIDLYLTPISDFIGMLASRSEMAAKESGYGQRQESERIDSEERELWPERYLTDLRITLESGVTRDEAMDDEEWERVKELTSIMETFEWEDGSSEDEDSPSP